MEHKHSLCEASLCTIFARRCAKWVMRFGMVVEMGISRVMEFFKRSVVNTRQESGRKPMDFGVETVCIDFWTVCIDFPVHEIWTTIKPV